MVEFQHILCPTDFSESAQTALTYAGELARSHRARLTVLHVVPTFDPMPVGAAGLGDPLEVVYPVSRDEVLGELRAVAERAGAPRDAALAVDAGDPCGAIRDRAIEIRADLIVMGTHGRSGVERLVIGSVTETVLRKAPCPVLVVPPNAAPSPAGFRLRNILCCMDFSPGAMQAFGFALGLARRAGGSVTVLHVLESLPKEEPRIHAPFDVAEYRRHLIGDARERLDALIAAERTSTPVEASVAAGRAHREILRVAAESAFDLITMGTQGRSPLGLAVFGSTAQTVVRAATCPVLAAPGVDVGLGQ